MIQLMRRILAVSGHYKGRIQAAFIFSFLKSLLAKAPIGLAFLVLTAFFYDSVTVLLCIWLGVGMVLCVVLQCLFQHAADRLQSGAGYMIFADMRMELGKHLRKMPMGYFTEGNIGKISSVLSTDMVFIEENCMQNIADMMSFIFSQIIMVAFLLFLNPWLAVLSAAIVLLIYALGRINLKSTMHHSDIRQAQSENLTRAVLDYTEGIGSIKTYNLLGDKSKELSGNFRESCRTCIDFEESQAPWMRGLYLCCGVGAAAVAALSLYLYSHNMLSVSFLVGMLLFVFDLFGPVKGLYGQSPRLTVMNSCMDRIEEVLREVELPDDGTQQMPETYDGPEVQFEHVRFSYQTDGSASSEKQGSAPVGHHSAPSGKHSGADLVQRSAANAKEVLHDISFTLEKNQMVALVGPSGGGKSTVANLLARFWDIDSGHINVRGKEIRSIPLSDLMDHISMVFQSVYLFQDTIYNNICMGRPDAAREEVIEAAKKARCYDFIMALPDGFDTVIGEGGETLSGGEKQRISIARCILKDAPIVILDEATASVDADNESYIQQAITELCQGKTLLVIAHRLNTIRHADKILVIDKGNICQSGTHETLMEAGGLYRDFVTMRERSHGWSR